MIIAGAPLVGIVNAAMFGTATEPGEYTDWSTPDVDTREGWATLLGSSVEDYAADNPHMIVFELTSTESRRA